MIQCHAFNSFTRMDLRDGGPYVLSQFVGGMAAPLFLFMAGMTTGFQMESLAQRESDPRRKWMVALKRGGYILLIAFTFRFTNWLFSVPRATLQEITKVDILNCMGVGLAVVAAGGAVLRATGGGPPAGGGGPGGFRSPRPASLGPGRRAPPTL